MGSVVLVSGLMVVEEIVAFAIRVVSMILTADFTGDGLVNYDDFWDFVARYGTRQGDANYSSRHDLTRLIDHPALLFYIFVYDTLVRFMRHVFSRCSSRFN